MEDQQAPDKGTMDRLLTQLGLRPEAIADDPIFSGFVAVVDTTRTPRHDRILGQADRWIAFLAGRDERLNRTASALLERMAARGPLPGELRHVGDTLADILDRIEWTLTALENWIESQMPPDDDTARWRVQWANGDGLAAWVTDSGAVSAATSLRQVVQAGAEFEGQFGGDAAHHLAAAIVMDLRSGALRLLRTLPAPEETTEGESLFVLQSRGAAYTSAIASLDDDGLTEAEASLARPETLRLAAMMDAAAYGIVAPLDASESPDAIPPFDVTAAVAHVAGTCHLSPIDTARCLLVAANHQLDVAAREGDYDATLRLATTISGLSRFIATESRR